MPTCRRKRVVLTEPSPALLEALKKDPSRDVFYLERTGELFETYESVPCQLLSPHFILNASPNPWNIQWLRRQDVILQAEAVSMRGHWQEWPELLRGAG
jgi:hypothetical protein